jgi:hypothetical protein
MSIHELERVEVMARVATEDSKLSDAAVMLELSYRQAKRLWTESETPSTCTFACL